jgi:alpha-tubulin suppressor-like RCC1 family protein
MPTNFRVSGVDTDDIFVRREPFIDAGLWIWGRNTGGSVGDNTLIARSSPVQTASRGTNWKQIETTFTSGAGIKTDGTLWLWGDNFYGSLGVGGSAARSSPIQILTGGNNWKQVSGFSASIVYFHAVKTDGTLWTWGYNTDARLGTNDTLHRSSPTQIFGGGTNWKTVSVGNNFSGAIKTDGTLWMWGRNDFGQLGNDTVIARSSPVQVTGTNWRNVSCAESQVSGTGFTAAIKTDGTLWTWGRAQWGVLGNSDPFTNRSSPVQVSGTNWKQVVTGQLHVAAIKTDGTLWTWGNNEFGTLGTNNVVSRSLPGQTVSGGTNWKEVSGSSFSIAAVKTDGTLWVWGYNNYQHLGTNDTLDRSSPTQIFGGGTNWRSASMSTRLGAGIREDYY